MNRATAPGPVAAGLFRVSNARTGVTDEFDPTDPAVALRVGGGRSAAIGLYVALLAGVVMAAGGVLGR